MECFRTLQIAENKLLSGEDMTKEREQKKSDGETLVGTVLYYQFALTGSFLSEHSIIAKTHSR